MPINELQTRTEKEEQSFSVGEHLEELRTRVILCMVATLVCFAVCWVFKTDILVIASRPHGLTMQDLGLPATLKVLSYQEGFFAYLKLCIISAMFLAYPFLIYQAWCFVGVGLYPNERRYVKIFLPISFVAFITGSLFGYFFLIPLCLYFLLNILGSAIEPIITMSQYITLVFLLTLALGIVFQIPLVMLLLARIGVCNAEDYARYRKHILLGIFILAAIITPPDPFSQLSTAIPMLGLYELGILLVRPTRTSVMYAAGITLALLLGVSGLYLYITRTEIARVSGGGAVTISGPKDQSAHSLRKGAVIETKENSRTTLTLTQTGDARVHVNRATRLTITGKKSLRLERGEILVDIKDIDDSFDISTPCGLVAISEDSAVGEEAGGVELDVKVQGGSLTVTAISGVATVTTEEERRIVRAGRQLTLSPGGRPVDLGEITNWAKGLGEKQTSR
ncbi:MAG: twin-arginine translocase subunit TatC [Planctomycetes bacterium]|nr:twin-arginine translocase subunit TatC [Planctomycetota bacterium]